MSLCDPDPETSYQRDCDVSAPTLQNVNELAGAGDVCLLPGGTDSPRTSEQNSAAQSEAQPSEGDRGELKEREEYSALLVWKKAASDSNQSHTALSTHTPAWLRGRSVLSWPLASFLLILPRLAVHYERSLMLSGPVTSDTALLFTLPAKLLRPRKLLLSASSRHLMEI